MKSTELMCGDLVQVKSNSKIIKVEAIHNKKVGYHICNYRLEWIRQSLIQPIPLTDEILEKNGFKYNKEETEGPIQSLYEHYTKFFDFPLGYRFWIKHDTVDNEFSIMYHCWIKFKYVHQFQQVLRMCKIEKEIKI